MKQQKTALFVLRLSLTLLMITALVAAALAGINAITAPVIAQLQAEKTQAAVEQVLPGGGTLLESYSDETGLVQAVYTSQEGYAIQVTPAGFDGTINMMVGVDTQGKVLGVTIISHTETAGLGAVAAADNTAGEAFRGSFTGASGQVSLAKDGGSIDAITGATITSRAVTQGVNAALACAAGLS